MTQETNDEKPIRLRIWTVNPDGIGRLQVESAPSAMACWLRVPQIVGARQENQVLFIRCVDVAARLMIFELAFAEVEMPCCKICGCTEQDACPGGCGWADPDRTLCTRCAGNENGDEAEGEDG
jgi:hypothetical protein